MAHPGVIEAGVIGKPDPIAGEIVKAFVTLRPGFVPPDELELLAFGRRRLRGMGPNAAAGGLSVTSGVAARAHAPVVAVPAGWRPPTPQRTPVVTVGVEGVETSCEIVRIALEEASVPVRA